ncbi:MAG: hypothetical protein AVDCRST_MAG72-1855 [uncultured Nocardioidaceae bacterium]|uniref:Sulfotransferase family protein n=1 Tax=uncultured Nocardioidaceae bacterium TaxID=253824 RepID=A0A6J4MG64_9ACTN|nr:MAG: hypothetical protein AVDCRST_MAG72-1855 [uncultured Nocardioidaceae bacterium]
MARAIYLHIGVPKAATTFLQSVMWHNKEVLAQQGVLYPGRRRSDHYRASQLVQGRRVRQAGDNAASWDRIIADLADWSGDGLISHEFFCMATTTQAKTAVERLSPAQVHVVLTARDYVRQFPAAWQQALKMDCDLSLDEFMDRALRFDLPGRWGWQSQDVPAIISRWLGAVPPQNMHLVTVPPPDSPGVLWRRWCDVIGVDPDAFDLGVASSNQSLGAPQAALLRHISPLLSAPLDFAPERYRWFRRYFGQEVLSAQTGPRIGLRRHQAEQLRALSLDAVASIAELGCEVHGDLEELIPETEQASRPHPDDVSDSEMLQVASLAIETMLRDRRLLILERDRLRRRSRRALPRSVRTVARRARRTLRRRHSAEPSARGVGRG